MEGTGPAGRIRGEVAAEVARLGALRLATVLVGDDPASQIYVAGKHRASEEVGIRSIGHVLSADTPEADLIDLIEDLNADDAVSGMIVQLPLPPQIDAAHVIGIVDPRKDVDGLTPINAGLLAQGRPGLVPATPLGVMELLDRSETELEGAEAVVVGRSDLVGKPVAALLLARHATVTICHSRTRDLGEVCRRADALVAAVGRPKLVTGEMVKPGATVIDVGMNRTDEGLVGDVDFAAASEKARAITPVPGGVGPMTIAMLLRNTLAAARLQTAERV
jgi:methylenetetrahydrofolate dehydrogenase (NADP+) / methenyltetrahydrofolate cyclohydrolase